MKKFYNRKKELKLLEGHYKIANNNLFTEVMMGRRRIGKTELIKKYTKGKNALYFYVTKKSSQIILDDFVKILSTHFSFVPSRLNNWEDFFNIIFEVSKKEKIIIVFDEFQNFNFVDKSIFSILQKKIDEYKNKIKMHLILIGSIQTLMQEIFLEKEPLHGRVDNFIYLEGFEFKEIMTIAADHKVQNLEQIFNLYSIFNGVAKYYTLLEKYNLFNQVPQKILQTLCINKNTPLYKEGEHLLIQEFGQDYGRYFDILFAISIGKTKSNEIADLMQLPITTIGKYLNILTNKHKLIKQRTSAHKKTGRNNRYYLQDVFLKFWFRYVYKHYDKIEIDETAIILQDFKKSFKGEQGLIFEELSRKILLKNILNKKIKNLPFLQISNYWDKKYEFDIYAKNGPNYLIGEIKLNNQEINRKLIQKIEDFVSQRLENNNKFTKIIITFHQITDKSIIKILKQKDFYIFCFEELVN